MRRRGMPLVCFFSIALSLCCGSAFGQEPLRRLTAPEFELIRASLPARENIARTHMERMQKEERLGQAHSFKPRPAYLDTYGQVHVRYDQFFRGVRIWDGMAVVHLDSDGRVLEPTKAIRRHLNQSAEPKVRLEQAQARAAADPAMRGLVAAPTVAELVFYPVLGERISPVRSKPGEKLNAEDVDRYADYHILAWHIRLQADSPDEGFLSYDFIVDAMNGDVFKSWNSLQTGEAVGLGKSQHSGDVKLNTNSITGGFELRDLTRASQPHPIYGFTGNTTYDMSHSTTSPTIPPTMIYTDADNIWGDYANYIPGSPTADANGQTAAVDAHYGLQVTWDYFKNVHGRNGIDGSGSAVVSRVHYGTNYSNAFWSDSCFCMTLGDGNGSTIKVFTALDVTAHEMTHGVTSKTAGLVYEDEPGGLNEATSDIFATMTEFYARGGSGSTIGNIGGTWTIGEQITATPLRYMQKPSKDGRSLDEWTMGMGLADVHFSSGPMNRAFYFLSQGASSSGADDSYTPRLPSGMTGIGNDKAARIWFRAVSAYLTPYSFYWDARSAAIRAARDLYGPGSTEVAAVKNAFAGINVGASAGADDEDPTIIISGPGTTSGTMNFTASASDNVGVTQVDYFLDGLWLDSKSKAPYDLSLDSTQIINGNHELKARARDAAGNIAHSNILTFTSLNDTEQLISNPGLESGTFRWGYNTSGIILYEPSPTNAHSGNYFLRLGGRGVPTTTYAYQYLSLPATALSLNLSFWIKIATNALASQIRMISWQSRSGTPRGRSWLLLGVSPT